MSASIYCTPPTTGENEVPVLKNGAWEKTPDYRGKNFWDTNSKEKHAITKLGVTPDPGWTELEPSIIQVWNGETWVDKLSLWLDLIVRPERDQRLAASDKYVLPDFPIFAGEKDAWVAYRQVLRDFPATLTVVVDAIPWPIEPS